MAEATTERVHPKSAPIIDETRSCSCWTYSNSRFINQRPVNICWLQWRTRLFAWFTICFSWSRLSQEYAINTPVVSSLSLESCKITFIYCIALSSKTHSDVIVALVPWHSARAANLGPFLRQVLICYLFHLCLKAKLHADYLVLKLFLPTL